MYGRLIHVLDHLSENVQAVRASPVLATFLSNALLQNLRDAFLSEVKPQLSRIENSRCMLSDVAEDPEMKELASEELAMAEAALHLPLQSLMERLVSPDVLHYLEEEAFDALVNLHDYFENFGFRPDLVAESSSWSSLLAEDLPPIRSVVLEIRPGTGGDEAAIFAEELFRMYIRYAASNPLRKWSSEIISDSGSPLTLRLKGKDVFQRMRWERGVHRIQRVPQTETAGRVHTSTVSVAVLPEDAEAADASKVVVRSEDLRVDTYRASGAGGQHVNKTDSAIRITHLPTGIVVQCQDDRSQHRNRDKAMRLLVTKLAHMRQTEAAQQRNAKRAAQIGSSERSEKIRTYHGAQDRVTDHRCGHSVGGYQAYLDGDASTVDRLLGRLLDWDYRERRIPALLGVYEKIFLLPQSPT